MSYERNEEGCCTGWGPTRFLGRHEEANLVGNLQIEPENSDAGETDRLKGNIAKEGKYIELLKKRVAESNEREQDLMEKLDRLKAVANGKNAGGEKVMDEMEAEITQLKKRLKRRASKLLKVEKDAKERNDRKETSIKRLEAKVDELRRLNGDANREVSRKAWSVKKLEERVAELNQQVKGTTTVAETRRLLQEKTAELSILEAENQRNASKAKKVDDLEARLVVLNRALQDKKARLSDLEVQSRQSAWEGNGSDTTVVELNQRLQEEMVKVSEMKEAARHKEKEMRVLEEKVAELNQRVRGEASRWKGKGIEQPDDAVAELNRLLQEEIAKSFTIGEAALRKEKETKGLEAKTAELGQRLTEASRRKERDMEHLESQKAETKQRLQEKIVKLSNLEDVVRRDSRKEKDTDWLETRVGELEQRLQENTAKLSNLEEVARQNSRKERESKRLETRVAGLELQLQEKTARLSNMEEIARQNSRKERESQRLATKIAGLELQLQEKTVKLSSLEEASRRISRKGESSERLEVKVTELTTKLSTMEDDARRREQKNRDLSATNQKQRDEINQLKALVTTAGEQASKPPLQALVSKDDSILTVEVANLVRTLNAQIEYVSCAITDLVSRQELPSSGEASAALNNLRDHLGPWLFFDLRRRLNEPETKYDPLMTQIALQTVLIRICNRIINHWNLPFWNDDSTSSRVNNTGRVGHVIAGTRSALAPSIMTMSQSEVQEANVKYLSEILVKLITAAGGSLQNGASLPAEYQEKVKDTTKRALELHQIVRKDVASMGIATYAVSSDALFDPSQMDDTEGTTYKAIPQDRVICTLEMGVRYRKRAEIGKQGGYGEEYGVILKPRVVLSTTLEA